MFTYERRHCLLQVTDIDLFFFGLIVVADVVVSLSLPPSLSFPLVKRPTCVNTEFNRSTVFFPAFAFMFIFFPKRKTLEIFFFLFGAGDANNCIFIDIFEVALRQTQMTNVNIFHCLMANSWTCARVYFFSLYICVSLCAFVNFSLWSCVSDNSLN